MEHLTTSDIDHYRSRTLSADEYLQISDHVVACDVCRQNLQSGSADVSSYNGFETVPLPDDFDEEHISYEEMVAFLEDKAPPALKELVQGHIELCALCREEEKELRAFRATLTTYPDAPVAPATSQETRSWLSRFRAGTFPLRPVPFFAAAGGVCVLTLTVGFIANGLGYRQGIYAANAAVARAQSLQEKAHQADIARAAALADLTEAKQALQVQREQAAGQQQARAAEKKVLTAQVADLTRRLAARPAPPDALLLTATPPRETGVTMGSGEEVVPLLSPLNTFVAATRPVLRWQALSDAAQYVLRVTSPGSDINYTALLQNAQVTSVTANFVRSLPRGMVFRWSVQAKRRDGTLIGTGIGRFAVISGPEANKFAACCLQQGREYERAGLLDEAHQEYERIPDDTPQYAEAQRALRRKR